MNDTLFVVGLIALFIIGLFLYDSFKSKSRS